MGSMSDPNRDIPRQIAPESTPNALQRLARLLAQQAACSVNRESNVGWTSGSEGEETATPGKRVSQ